MKLLQVTFRCFGPFEEKSLDFSGGNLHVIFGPNEAGKSSALRGLYALLFGFGHTTTDDYRFKTTQFRIEAALQSASGEVLTCVRRKGKKATLMSPDEKTEIAAAQLTQYLGGLTESQFEQLFGLDSARLVAGGEEIAEGQGDLGEALFAAGAGLAGLRKLAESLTQRQGELYKSRSPTGRSSLPINAALREYKEALDAAREQALPPEKYAAAVADAAAKEALASQLRVERERVRRELEALQLQQLALPAIELLQRACERLEPVKNSPRLPSDFGDKLHAALRQRDLDSARLQDLTTAREELERSQATASPPENLLAEAAEIDDLKGLVAADWSTREECLKAESRRNTAQGEARDIFRSLTGTTNWILMDLLQPRDDEEKRIHELAAEAKAVAESVATSQQQLATAREALDEAKSRQAEFHDLADPTPLQALVESLSGLGPLEEKARETQRKLTTDEQWLAAEFARLQPTASGDWQGVRNLAVPPAATIGDFRQQFEKAQRALDKLHDEREKLERDRTSLQEQRAAANPTADPLPSLADLSATRAARDQGMQLLRRRLSNEAEAAAEKSFNDQYAAGRPLFEATEQLVRHSDHLADRLRTDAEQIARWQAIEQNLQVLQRNEQAWQTAHASATAAHTELQRAWEACWQPTSIQPKSPTVMEAWLATWQRICDRMSAWQESSHGWQDTQQQIAEARTRLAEACPATRDTKSLAEGLRRASQMAKEAANRQAEATKLQDSIRRLTAQLSAAEGQQQQALRRHDQWKKDWAGAIQPLGLNDDSTSVDTALNYLKRIATMQEHLKEFRIKRKQAEELTAVRAKLLQRWNALRLRLHPTAKASTLETLADDFRQLELALQAARENRTKQQERAARLQKNSTELQSAADQLRTAEAELRALAALASVNEPAELSAALQRSQDRDAAEQEMRTHEQVLAGHARGQPLVDFIAAALAARDALPTDIAARSTRAEQLDPLIQDAEAAALEASRLLKGYEQASNAAAEARQRAEFLVTRLKEQVTEFAALQLAGLVLERAKDRYRARHQDTLLSRAGEFFRTLTDEKFAGLEIDNEDGNDVLKAVRPAAHPLPRVPVSGLSEGTRDQLFLALRLAGIEQHLQNREPVPLIIDDVLMTFDDDRSRATLRCLAELSTKTQVLLFTHHRHVAELAREVQPATIVHEL